MSETGLLFDNMQDSAVWGGLRPFSRLPGWLVEARNPDRVCARLSHIVPDFVDGRLLLQGCDVGHIRYKDDHWTGLYHVTTCRAGKTTQEITTLEGSISLPSGMPHGQPYVAGVFGQPGWRAVMPDLNLTLRAQESETALGSLGFLTDPEASRWFLMHNIRAGSHKYEQMEILASNPKVVRYKPGSRCTVLYRLQYTGAGQPDQSWPDVVVAKIYRGEKGKNAYDSMLALWNSRLGSSNTVQIAEPLAYNEEQRVMIQGPVREERTLKKFIIAAFGANEPGAMEELEPVIRKTAAGLAQLHQSGVALGQMWAWEDELSEVRERIDRLSIADPSLAPGAEPLLDRLIQLAADSPPDPPVPSHGSFRPAQVLLHRDQIGFIDFDSFCQSEPANDLALFLSTVLSLGLTSSDFDDSGDSGTFLDENTRRARFETAMSLSDSFLREYEKNRPVSRQRVALWAALDILMLVLHGWIKVKPGELSDSLYLLETFLQSKGFSAEQ